MTKRYRWLAVCLGLSVLALMLKQPATVIAAPESLTTPIAFDTCDLWCLDDADGGCDPNEHFAYEPLASPGYWRAGGQHYNGYCAESTCQLMHGRCTPLPGGDALTDADVETVRVAVLNGDTDALTKLIVSHPQELVLNAKRGALQVNSCVEVVAHFPLSSDLAKSIAHSVSDPRGR